MSCECNILKKKNWASLFSKCTNQSARAAGCELYEQNKNVADAVRWRTLTVHSLKQGARGEWRLCFSWSFKNSGNIVTSIVAPRVTDNTVNKQPQTSQANG